LVPRLVLTDSVLNLEEEGNQSFDPRIFL
jgi:hypothetical protein